jgi:hypothetical protein
MELNNIKRRKFFFLSGASILGFFAARSVPFKFFGSSKNTGSVPSVKENKLAVKRTKGRSLNG